MVKMEKACGDSIIVDKLVFCRKHPAKICELNCVDCYEVICFMCKAVTHKMHEVESIEDGVKRVVQEAREGIEMFQRQRDYYIKEKEELGVKVSEVNEAAARLVKQVQARYCVVITQATQERDDLLKSIETYRLHDVDTLQQEIAEITKEVNLLAKNIDCSEATTKTILCSTRAAFPPSLFGNGSSSSWPA